MDNSIFDLSAQNKETAGKIVVGLERISEAFRVLLWQHAKITGLSPIQIQMLIFIRHHDPELANVSHLAREFNLSKPTVSDAVKALEKKALIEKQTSPHDKRSYTIVLTPEGERAVAESAHFADPLKTLTEKLSPSDQEELYEHLYNLIFALNRQGILTVQRMCHNCRFYEKRGQGHYCRLLDIPLKREDVRIDCPEFE